MVTSTMSGQGVQCHEIMEQENARTAMGGMRTERHAARHAARHTAWGATYSMGSDIQHGVQAQGTDGDIQAYIHTAGPGDLRSRWN